MGKHFKKAVGRVLFFDFKGCYKRDTLTGSRAAARMHWEAKFDDQYSNLIGRKRIYQTPEALQEAIDLYFESCEGIRFNKFGHPVLDTNGDPVRVVVRPYTISGLANAIGISTDTLRRYKIISARNKIPLEYAVIVDKAKQRIAQYAEEALYDMGSQRGAQFVLQAGFQWNTQKEDTDIRATKARMKLAERSFALKEKLLDDDNDDSEITINIVRARKKDEE